MSADEPVDDFDEFEVERQQWQSDDPHVDAIFDSEVTVTPAPGPPMRDNNGYYHMPDGRKLLSVTNIIELGVPKPNLVHWAAWEVSRCAMDYLPRLLRARGDEQRRAILGWLQKAAERRRDDAANLGSAIHDAAEAHILGTPWPEPTDEQRPYIEAFHRFCLRFRPQWEAAEMTLANLTDGWAGKADAWVWLAIPEIVPSPAMVLIDWKTGKNIYPEAALQLSAYNHAEIGFLRDGTQIIPPHADHAAVVHLRPSKYSKTGGYRVRPVDISEETYAAFLTAKRTAEEWVRGRSSEVLGKPYPEPAPAKKVA